MVGVRARAGAFVRKHTEQRNSKDTFNLAFSLPTKCILTEMKTSDMFNFLKEAPSSYEITHRSTFHGTVVEK